MTNTTLITCRLIISGKQLAQLNPSIKKIFTDDETGFYFTEFPAKLEEDANLGTCIVSFCEVVLVMGNPKYELDETSTLDCELLKLGSSESSFNLLINISYPNVEDSFHDILVFKEKEQSPGFYSFELLGDQTMFTTE